MAHERKCIVCPSKHHYKYCANCGDYNSYETWRYTFCSENCRDIYKVCEDFANNRIDALKAQEMLKSHDLSDRNDYLEPLKKNLDDIYSTNFKRNVKKSEESVIDLLNNESLSTEINDINIETKPKRSYRKNSIND